MPLLVEEYAEMLVNACRKWHLDGQGNKDQMNIWISVLDLMRKGKRGQSLIPVEDDSFLKMLKSLTSMLAAQEVEQNSAASRDPLADKRVHKALLDSWTDFSRFHNKIIVWPPSLKEFAEEALEIGKMALDVFFVHCWELMLP